MKSLNKKSRIKKEFIDFIKPNILKIIIFIILLIVTIFIPKTTLVCGPAPYLESCGEAPVLGIGYPMFYGEKCLGDVCGFWEFSIINFIINIIIYYMISCFILSIFKNFRNKNEKLKK